MDFKRKSKALPMPRGVHYCPEGYSPAKTAYGKKICRVRFNKISEAGRARLQENAAKNDAFQAILKVRRALKARGETVDAKTATVLARRLYPDAFLPKSSKKSPKRRSRGGMEDWAQVNMKDMDSDGLGLDLTETTWEFPAPASTSSDEGWQSWLQDSDAIDYSSWADAGSASSGCGMRSGCGADW